MKHIKSYVINIDPLINHTEQNDKANSFIVKMWLLFIILNCILYKKILKKYFSDVTSVCMLDGFQNEAYLKMADKILKELSKIAAKETFKVIIM